MAKSEHPVAQWVHGKLWQGAKNASQLHHHSCPLPASKATPQCKWIFRFTLQGTCHVGHCPHSCPLTYTGKVSLFLQDPSHKQTYMPSGLPVFSVHTCTFTHIHVHTPIHVHTASLLVNCCHSYFRTNASKICLYPAAPSHFLLNLL